MYFVDRNAIEATLEYIDKLLSGFDGLDMGTLNDKLALERIVHMVGESVLDVGNMMIDGFIMRDPGGYEDIIDILIDEEVLPETDKQAYYDIIRLRKPLVKDYLQTDHALLQETMSSHRQTYACFPEHIRAYLNNGPDGANAFSNNSRDV